MAAKRLQIDLDKHHPSALVAVFAAVARYADWPPNEIEVVQKRCLGQNFSETRSILDEYCEPEPKIEIEGRAVLRFHSRWWESKAWVILSEYWHAQLGKSNLDYVKAVAEMARDLTTFGTVAMKAIGGTWDFCGVHESFGDKRYTAVSIESQVLTAAAKRIVPDRYGWEVQELNGRAKFFITRGRVA